MKSNFNINGINIELIEQSVDKYLSSDRIVSEKSKVDDNQNCFKKILSNAWDGIIDWSIDNGNQHFAITINTPYREQIVNNNYCHEDNEKSVYLFYENIRSILFHSFPSITWFLIVNEENKEQKTHFHLIIAIRNFIDYNYTLKKNIKKRLHHYSLGFNDDTSVDIKVESLIYFKDIKNWVMYLHKDYSVWKFKSYLYYTYLYEIMWVDKLGDIYFDFLIPNANVMLCNLDIVNIDFKSKESKGFYYDYLSEYKSKLKPIFLINGIKLTYNKIDERTLINLLQYYLILNEYYIYKDNIYEKIKRTKISYILVGSLKEVLYDKFQENVVLFFINNLKYYFKGFDFNYLLDTYFIKTKSVIESIVDISTQRIEPNFDLIECTDGVYSIKYDRFFSSVDNLSFNTNVSTIKYYNKTFQSIRKRKPDNWIKGIKNALNISGDELENTYFNQICKSIINTIHKDIKSKKCTLFIYGKSNTGKTTLIANPIINFYGNYNVGSIIGSKNFKWQELEGKEVGIIDEGRYNSSMSSDLLKLTGQENIIVEKKYSKGHVLIKPIPLIILTNNIFEDKNPLVDEALRNRMNIIQFLNEISELDISANDSQSFKDRIKEEEANIIVYCNKVLFKQNKNKGDRISSKILIKMIDFKINTG